MFAMLEVARTIRLASFILLCGTAFCLTGCNDHGGDPEAQIGPHPNLPDLSQYLIPPMHIAHVVGWKKAETPTVARGLKIQALATGLQHPRSLYVLPNGDILVVESKSPSTQPVTRPKDIVMGWVESWATSGGDTGPSNRITLLRDTNGDGVPDSRSVFLDHLNSPFGVALIGDDLYVADTDAIVKYPYKEGDTKITAPGATLTELPADPSTITGPRALQPVRTVLSYMSESAPTATLPRTASKRRGTAQPSGRSTEQPAVIVSSRVACAIRMVLVSNRRAVHCGRW